MPIRPEDIQNKKFKVVTGLRKGGYDEVEVDTFLDEIEVELRSLLEENASLRQRLEQSLAQPPAQAAPVASEAEEMLRRTLVLAQRTADETVAGAQADAERMMAEARQAAHSMVEAARAEAAAATSDLERRRQALEQHIEGLRAFEREYRTRLKAYLESQLRDLDGRGGPADAAAVAATPPAVPAPPPQPAVAAPPAQPAVAPAPPRPAVGGPPAAPPAPQRPPHAAPPSAPPAAPQAALHAPQQPPAAPRPPVAGVPNAVPPAARPPLAPGAAYGEPEPFDIDEGGSGVPRLAP